MDVYGVKCQNEDNMHLLEVSRSSGQAKRRRLDWPLHLLAGWVAAERRRLGWSKNWPLLGVAAKRRRLECQ